jgi:hypothetical protein
MTRTVFRVTRSVSVVSSLSAGASLRQSTDAAWRLLLGTFFNCTAKCHASASPAHIQTTQETPVAGWALVTP